MLKSGWSNLKEKKINNIFYPVSVQFVTKIEKKEIKCYDSRSEHERLKKKIEM